MPYQGLTQFDHTARMSTGVLLVNLGSPAAPTPSALRRYLAEFLWDPRVVEVPRPLWWMILHGIILRFRPARSARKYATVWTPQGSPLVTMTQAQCQGLSERLQNWPSPLRVVFAMRYGAPSIEGVVKELLQQGVNRLLVVPLYPQYSATTTASVFDGLAQTLMKQRWIPELRFLTHYHDDPRYIDACATRIREHWAQHGRPQKLLLSYHGIPRRYFEAGDPYHCECHKTSRLIAEALELPREDCLTTFQSRFGREPWLQPYTDHTLQSLPGQGVTDVHVFCPGFSADCLETLEEIDEENRELFLEAGGQRFHYIPALNDHSAHLDALEQLIRRELHGWDQPRQPHAEAWQRLAAADPGRDV